ncbi:MAG: erythromycin esterase [Promethearchaeota archaeon CR_4]|nr:MAG: erythromycin esterase [Candidatus Lokiarchaeota archaeon CR_4]
MSKQPGGAPAPSERELDDWIANEAIPFSIDSPATFNVGVAKVVASFVDSVELLGFGEALHGGEDILLLRNQLFQRLVEAHGYSAIAIESSFPRGRVVNQFVSGRGPASYDVVQDTGFSHSFGKFEANRELIEWMRQYNANPAHRVKLQFYGFDSPTEMSGGESPKQVLHFVLDYLTSIDTASGQKHRKCIDPLLGQDSAWENPAAMMDPNKSIGLSPAASALRIETEDLFTELWARRPELVAMSDESRYLEAMHYASVARQLLNYHATMARTLGDRIVQLLGIRDAMMADNLAYVVSRERGRGKVFVFAHNSHLQRGKTQMQLGPDVYTWWPAGSHLTEMFGLRYAVIGSAVGVSDANDIGQPEAGSLEARLIATPGPGRFIPTHKGQGLPDSVIATLPTRLGSIKNPTYFPLNPQSLTDFDWFLILDSTPYCRGGPPLP